MAVTRRWRSGAATILEPKEQAKARLGRSCDRADALALAVAGHLGKVRQRGAALVHWVEVAFMLAVTSPDHAYADAAGNRLPRRDSVHRLDSRCATRPLRSAFRRPSSCSLGDGREHDRRRCHDRLPESARSGVGCRRCGDDLLWREGCVRFAQQLLHQDLEDLAWRVRPPGSGPALHSPQVRRRTGRDMRLRGAHGAWHDDCHLQVRGRSNVRGPILDPRCPGCVVRHWDVPLGDLHWGLPQSTVVGRSVGRRPARRGPGHAPLPAVSAVDFVGRGSPSHHSQPGEARSGDASPRLPNNRMAHAVLLGVLWLVLGITKAVGSASLVSCIRDLLAVEPKVANCVAWALIAAEIALGSLLLLAPAGSRALTRIVTWCSLAISSGVVFFILLGPRTGTCGCFGQAFVATPERRLVVACAIIFLSAGALRALSRRMPSRHGAEA